MKHQGFRQFLVWLLTTIHLTTISGCSSTNRVTLPGNEIPIGSDFKIVSIVLKNGDIVKFDGNGGRYVERPTEGKSHRVIVGMVGGKGEEIDPESALEVRFEQEGSGGGGSFAVGFLLGIPVGAGLLFLLLVSAYSGH